MMNSSSNINLGIQAYQTQFQVCLRWGDRVSVYAYKLFKFLRLSQMTSKQADIQKIAEQIDKMAQIRKQSKDKSLAYQHKILQLLLQEKTTRLMNQKLSSQITKISDQKQQLNVKRIQLQTKLQAEMNRYKTMQQTYSQKFEETSRQMGLAKMKWLDLQEKNEELQLEVQTLKVQVQQGKCKYQELKGSYQLIQKQCQEYKTKVLCLAEQQASACKKITETNYKLESYQAKLANLEEQLTQKLAQLTHLRNIHQKTQSQKESLSVRSSQLSIALDKSKALNTQYILELRQFQQDFDLLSEKAKSLERQNIMLKDRKKEIEDDAYRFELERETMASNLKKMEKEMKKVKQELKDSLNKEQELQEEVASGNEKIKNIDKALKKYKKQIQELKEALIAAEETSGSEASRMKKWQITARSQRQRISQLQQSLSVKQQQLSTLQSQLQTSEKARFELGFQLEKATKEKQVLSELNLQLQERRVLMEGQREKALTQLVKQKDVFSRANFKLLQLLQLKQQAIRAILKTIINGGQKVEVSKMFLGAQGELEQLLSVSVREKLLNPRQRPRYLSEWLGRK